MRIGKIQTTIQIYKEDYYLFSDYLFKVFIPHSIDHQLNGIIEFQGESELFEDIEECSPIPSYEVIFTRMQDESFTYKFTKR